MVTKTMNIIEGLVREGSFKWLLGSQSSFDEELDEMERSPSAPRNWIPQLSAVANVIVRRCSRILGISTSDLQENFDSEASDSIKHPSQYPRHLLEYCCFRALEVSVQKVGHLADKKFRRLTYDMMLAWESPDAASKSLVDEYATVGIEAFSRIAPAVPIIANVIIIDNLFGVLTASSGGRLQFSSYEKYLAGLERAIRKLKTQTESSLLSSPRSSRREKILEVEGTVPTQPVLEHIGISTWPGRLTLTDHVLYFEPLCVVSYDKAKRYDLSKDDKQVVKPELTGPWGTRLFDRAIFCKSITISEPFVIEFPELKGHTRRDYWLAIIREILYVHRFIHKYNITGIGREDVLSKAVLGILRVQAIQDINALNPMETKALLMFNLCDTLPGGDIILETLARMSTSKEFDQTANFKVRSGMYSMSALNMVSNLGISFRTSLNLPDVAGIIVGEIAVGGMTALEGAVKESRSNYEKVVSAQATIDGVKVDGIDTNLAVMKELLFPVMELWKWLLSMAYWDDPIKSLMFCTVNSYIICRGWLAYAIAAALFFIAVFIAITRLCNQGMCIDELKVIVPPPMTKMDQILAVQNALSRAEVLLQDGNVILLKTRALLLSIFPQASQKFAVVLLLLAVTLAVLPSKFLALVCFLDTFTRHSPPRRASTERWIRRLREWWFSVPAAPVVLEKDSVKEEEKKK